MEISLLAMSYQKDEGFRIIWHFLPLAPGHPASESTANLVLFKSLNPVALEVRDEQASKAIKTDVRGDLKLIIGISIASRWDNNTPVGVYFRNLLFSTSVT